MQLFKQFALPGDLSTSLNVSVIVQWMAEKLLECKSDEINWYRTQPLDLPNRKWLDRWIERTQYRAITSMLAPLMDNKYDWHLIRSKEYGGQGCFVFLTHKGVLS